jgi:hypothetical protein
MVEIQDLNKFCKEIKDLQPVIFYVRKRGFYNSTCKLNFNGITTKKKGKGRPIGIAFQDFKGKVRIGWSFCRIKTDKFNRDLGLYIAAKRAVKHKPFKSINKFLESYEVDWQGKGDISIPHLIRKLMPRFLEKVAKRFNISKKNKN